MSPLTNPPTPSHPGDLSPAPGGGARGGAPAPGPTQPRPTKATAQGHKSSSVSPALRAASQAPSRRRSRRSSCSSEVSPPSFLSNVDNVAPTDAPLLITGETGTGSTDSPRRENAAPHPPRRRHPSRRTTGRSQPASAGVRGDDRGPPFGRSGHAPLHAHRRHPPRFDAARQSRPEDARDHSGAGARKSDRDHYRERR